MGCPPTTICGVLNIPVQRHEKVKKEKNNPQNFHKNKNTGGGKKQENILYLLMFRNFILLSTFFLTFN